MSARLFVCMYMCMCECVYVHCIYMCMSVTPWLHAYLNLCTSVGGVCMYVRERRRKEKGFSYL